MKPGQHQRSKQRCQDLCWKDRAQSFVLRSYTKSGHELRNQNVSIDKFLVLCMVKAEKENKSIRQRPLPSFITISFY